MGQVIGKELLKKKCKHEIIQYRELPEEFDTWVFIIKGFKFIVHNIVNGKTGEDTLDGKVFDFKASLEPEVA